MPSKQPKRSRLWLNDGSRIRLRPEGRDHVWSCDLVEDRTRGGRKCRVLNVTDGSGREALAMRVDRRLSSTDVIDVLTDLFILRGPAAYVRSDNGPEIVARAVRAWIEAGGATTAHIEPASPWENGTVESFDARFRDELLDGEVFHSLAEARIVIEDWRRDCNAVRPHSALGWRPPAPDSVVPLPTTPTMH